MKNLFHLFYKKRFLWGIFVILFFIILNLNGSSIDLWNTVLGDGEHYDGILLGKSRSIRSDEWATFTPMALSQTYSGFPYDSDVLRGTSTDMYIEYGQPVLNYAVIFRPFQIGYLFLGAERGLSFFWITRLVVLFLVSFEFGMLFLQKPNHSQNIVSTQESSRKIFAFIYSCFLTFSPLVQWWFSINGLVEMLVFAQLSLLIFTKYLEEKKKGLKFIYSILISWCACGYLLTFYPPWQVAIGYILLIFLIWILASHWKNYQWTRNDLFNLCGALFFFIGSIGYILYKSFDTIAAILNTAYPGSRIALGGGFSWQFFHYAMNIFMPFQDDLINISTNTCESASVFSLFPINLILAFLYFVHQKKKKESFDLPLILFVILDLFFMVWCMFEFPAFFAKITLLFEAPSNRVLSIAAIVNLFILIRASYLLKINNVKVVTVKNSLLYLFCLGIIIYGCKVCFPQYLSWKKITAMTLILIVLLILLFAYIQEMLPKSGNVIPSFLLLFSILIATISGAAVNPVQKGLDAVYAHTIIKEIKKQNEKQNGKWIVEGCGWPLTELPIFVGAADITSTNIYPNLSLWRKVDPDGIYEPIYNRYSHITVNITAEAETTFQLPETDIVTLNITKEDLRQLDATYILTQNNLSDIGIENYGYRCIYEKQPYSIYKRI